MKDGRAVSTFISVGVPPINGNNMGLHLFPPISDSVMRKHKREILFFGPRIFDNVRLEMMLISARENTHDEMEV
jgi:hypothetical protein